MTRVLDEIYIIMCHVGVPENSALLEFSCHCSPDPAFEEKPSYLVRTPDALFHRQFTDAESRLALFHGSWALGSPISP